MRFRLPEGCAGIVHAGVALTVAPDGTIEAEASAAAALAPHDIVPAGDEPPLVAKPARTGKRGAES